MTNKPQPTQGTLFADAPVLDPPVPPAPADPRVRYCKVCGCCDQLTHCNPPCRWLSLDVCTGCRDAVHVGHVEICRLRETVEVWRLRGRIVVSACEKHLGRPPFDEDAIRAVEQAVAMVCPGEPYIEETIYNPVSGRLAFYVEVT